MKKIVAFLSLLIFANCVIAQGNHTVTKSTITFQIKNLGINTGGTFSGLQASIQFDPANLGTSKIDATLDATSVNTDNDMRDDHLKSDSYFDVTKYPKITLKSVSFKHKSGNNYVGQFNVTIKDKTQLLDLPFTYTKTDNMASFKGTLKLQRTDFGIGGKSMVMSNDVAVSIEVLAKTS